MDTPSLTSLASQDPAPAPPPQDSPASGAAPSDGMDFIRNANAMKGSVTDTWTDTLIRALLGNAPAAGQLTQQPFHSPGGIDKAAGGAMGINATVLNPTDKWAQALQRLAPKVYQALERSPQEFRFGDMPRSQWGDAVTGQAYAPSVQGGPFHLTFNPVSAQNATLVHEPLHGLYGAKEIQQGYPAAYVKMQPRPDQAAQMAQSLPAGHATNALPRAIPALVGKDGLDAGHAALYGMVLNALRNSRVSPTDLVRFPL